MEPFNGLIRVGADDTLTMIQNSYVQYTIDEITIQSASGTATYSIEIDGVPVTGLSAISVTSSENTVVATALNFATVGDKVTLVRTADATALDVAFSIKLTRT